jgi:aspartate kinase
MEMNPVTGIACTRDEAKITLIKIPDRPGIAAAVFGALARAGVNVDMIVQTASDEDNTTEMTFTIGKGDLDRAKKILEGEHGKIGYVKLIAKDDVSKISLVGIGMRSHAGVAATMFDTLAKKGINIQVIETSEINISVLIAAEYTELALRSLHSVYGLDGK